MREATYATFKQVNTIFSWCYIYYIFFTTFIGLTNDSYNDCGIEISKTYRLTLQTLRFPKLATGGYGTILHSCF